MKKSIFTQHIQSADFKTLFNELGWDFKSLSRSVAVGEQTFTLEAVAEKRDFYAVRCSPDAQGKLPDQNARRSISRQFEKVKNYHLIIFTNRDGSEQRWQFVLRMPNRPPKFVETAWTKGQDVELLYQKVRGLVFDLDEEGNIFITDVLARVKDAVGVNTEKVTKKFYDGFKKEHGAFLGFINGIKASVDKDWYASLMLNRLMFCYFIQKKRFLDNNPNYLSDKLREVQGSRGKGQFYSFYRDFLLVLFHKGLNERGDKPALIGQVPYLNGGLFDVHELETRYPDIQIPDEAFQRIFNFFDQYEWHLDNRPGRTGNEINPDVIGYIFEKYINDRANMGAYYTKEDITDYISKNCIIPFLFDEAARHGANLKPCFALLRDDPDRYIYPAVRHGITWDYRRGEPLDKPVPLPPDIEAGLDTSLPDLVERRKAWNREAPPEAGLPTEWWREVVERRQRYADIKAKMQAGEVTGINDLITLNLDIRQFAQDALMLTDDPDFVRHFFAALTQVSVLDPTCGSGAFLFAALNILEPLYEACLDRMETFAQAQPGKFPTFKETLKEIADETRHPNREYYIYKKIIVHNLYGVDIMREAVEIAKLRLFLKLMSTVEADRRRPNLGLEPLPDVDFNIRAGNTLVGFATLAEAIEAIHQRDNKAGQQGRLVFGEELEVVRAVEEKAELVAKAYARFQDTQVVNDQGSDAHHRAKTELRNRLADLNDSLNVYNAFLYGIEKDRDCKGYDDWLTSHQPFHWFAEFYGVLYDKDGKFNGFDCVIGNPPYVELKEVKNYSIQNFTTISCGNLFVFVSERCEKIANKSGWAGLIIPLSAFSTDRMKPFIQYMKANSSELRIANFSWRPGKLFEGVNLQLSIFLQKYGKKQPKIETSNYILWDSIARNELFSKIQYSESWDEKLPGAIPKLGFEQSNSVLKKIRSEKNSLADCFAKTSSNKVFYRRGGLYWKVFVDFETGSSEEKIIDLLPEVDRYSIIAILSSNLWFWYLMLTSDCRHLGNRDIETFPIDPRKLNGGLNSTLSMLGKKYVKDLKKNAENTVRVYKGTKAVEVLSFRVNQSKEILDEIDTVLAAHYGFTEKELDFIINYDIKYRMGRGSGEE